jgi:hypothetical protein
LKRAKRYALDNDTSLTAIFVQALEDYLKERSLTYPESQEDNIGKLNVNVAPLSLELFSAHILPP